MFLLNRRQVLAAGGASVAMVAIGEHAFAEVARPEVFTSTPQGGSVDSAIIVGEKSALVIDAQFVAPDAAALVAEIEATGRELEAVFITHWHPDHHFGAYLLKQRWPEARLIAHPKVAGMLDQMGRPMFEDRKAVMGDAIPADWIAPEVHEGPLVLEGERFDVLDPLHGDTAEITPVDLPQFDAVIASDIVFNGTHVWLAETLDAAAFAAWRGSLDAIEALGRKEIIPGHRNVDVVNDASGIVHQRKALDAWEAVLAAGHKTAEEMRADMMARLGDLEGGFFLEKAIEAALEKG